MSRDTRIAILDMYDLSRHGLMSIARQHDFPIVGTFIELSACERALRERQANIVIINDDVPPPQFIEQVVEHLLGANPQAAILVLTERVDQRFFQRLLQLGVRGILHAHDFLESLFGVAVKTVLGGELFLSPKIAADAVQEQVKGELTPTQEQVLKGMGWGGRCSRWHITCTFRIGRFIESKRVYETG